MVPRPHSVTSAASLLVMTLLLGFAWAGPASAAPGPDRVTTSGVYVVTLAAPPAAAYGGGVPGLAGTRPVHGERFDRTRPAVAAYTAHLRTRQDRLLRSVGSPAVLYHYTTALDGFAASLTGDQAQRLREAPGVLRVERATKRRIDRAGSARAVGGSPRSLLGLTGPRGAWARYGGVERAGRGTVVGVVDSGIWPENPGFSGAPDRSPGVVAELPGFHGGCAAAEDWSIEDCTDKIVSARWFVRGFGAENTADAEHLSPRDGTGHGSHVASVAAGNDGVRVRIDGRGFGTTSGMAPAARIGVYKACWTAPDPDQDGCSTADTVAAVDAAVADGVDVLNYSVSGSETFDDAVERAFLGAASAGVFVATSAGNHGGAPGRVAHVAPWVTTVAASTHEVLQGAVRLGNGASYVGAMLADRPVRSTRLVLGEDVPAPDATRDAARRCAAGALDADAVDGRIVVCDRGAGARLDKSASVASSGGAGMVLANTRGAGTDADVHAVPTVHLATREAAAVKAYVRRAGGRATARLDPTARTAARVPAAAGFSSRGPAHAADGDVLKPDLTAPGVSVLGAVAPPSDSGRGWDLVSGTSTSAPHVAGLAAFVAGVHPRWSPARVKSAMMTTAYDLAASPGPLVEGAGHVDPRDFLDPGLVFDTEPAAWQRLAAGTVAARDVNAPSVAIGDLVGPTTVRRTITNVGSRRESWSVRVEGMRGVDVQAFPATVRLRPGQSRTVRLRITARPTARIDQVVTGWLGWRGARHLVRVPMSVRPTVVAAPRQVDGAGDSGRVVVRGRSGNGRTVKLRSSGLVAARSAPVSVKPGTFDPAEPRVDEDTVVREVPVPAGTDVVRFATDGSTDLYVYRGDRLVDSATTGESEVTLSEPKSGGYRVYVTAGTASSPTTDRFYSWVVPARGGSEVALSTDAVGFAPGRRFRYSASWDDLDPGKKYLGVVGYGDSDRRTLVEVN